MTLATFMDPYYCMFLNLHALHTVIYLLNLPVTIIHPVTGFGALAHMLELQVKCIMISWANGQAPRSIANWLLSWLTNFSPRSIILSFIAHVIFPIVILYCQWPKSLPVSTAAMHAGFSSNGVPFWW